jgi:signal peptidase I
VGPDTTPLEPDAGVPGTWPDVAVPAPGPQAVPAPGPEAAGASPDEGETVGRRVRGCAIEVIETVVLTLFIFLGIQTFVAQPYQVHMNSMERTFEEGQFVLVDKLSPHWSDYKRGDVIVLNPPDSYPNPTGDPFIKRVIGLPGETVLVQGGKILINGTPLDEPYVYDLQATLPEGSTDHWVVGAGQLFVMGDHRQMSVDSRTFGLIDHSAVIGRAMLRYWPLNVFGIVSAPSYGSVGATP